MVVNAAASQSRASANADTASTANTASATVSSRASPAGCFHKPQLGLTQKTITPGTAAVT